MDVEAGHTAVGSEHGLKRLVRNGKERMAAEHRLNHVAAGSLGVSGEVGK